MSTDKYLSLSGLQYFHNMLKENFASKNELNSLIQRKTFAEWLSDGDTIYSAGTILIYTDRTVIDGEYKPDLKLADGITAVKDLEFLTDQIISSLGFTIAENGNIVFHGTAQKLEHTLTIGQYVYDGSNDIIIPVYEGE